MNPLTTAPSVLIRAARGSDGPALRDLAALDSAAVPAGRLLAGRDRRRPRRRARRGLRRLHRRPVPALRRRRRAAEAARRPRGRGAAPPPGRALRPAARAVRQDRVTQTLSSPPHATAGAAPPAPAVARPAPPGWQVWTGLWIVYIVWGSTYLAIRIMVETVPPLLGAGVRFAVAGGVMVAVLAVRRGLARGAAVAGAAAERAGRRPAAAGRQRSRHRRRAGGAVRDGGAADRVRPAVGDPAAGDGPRGRLRPQHRCRARRLRGRRAAAAPGRAVGRRDVRRPAGVRRRRGDVGVGLVRLAAAVAAGRPARVDGLADAARRRRHHARRAWWPGSCRRSTPRRSRCARSPRCST